MRVFIIDFQGTLSLVTNPVGFVKALQAQGACVVLFSGSDPREIERRVPGLLDTVDEFVQKPADLRAVVDKRDASEVVIVDDEDFVGKALVRFGRGRKEPWRFLPAARIGELGGT